MDETVIVLLNGGICVPISRVTANYSPSNVVVYDGSTYRDDPVDLLAVESKGVTANYTQNQQQRDTYIGANTLVSAGVADPVSHTAPRYHGKQRTLWSFARTISSVAAFTHVLWADLISGTCSHAPWRVGATPTVVS